MSHGKLREDKTCLNCGHQVEERFCGHCGQENTETRQPFYYLFTHFFEDFTHYDGEFWGTLKNLFFKPGNLTNVYLSGKRQRFVPPVKLYIFVSFITFLIPTFFKTNINIKLYSKEIKQELQALKAESILDSNQVAELESEFMKLPPELRGSVLEKLKKGESLDSTSIGEIIFSSNTIEINGATSREEFDSLAREKNNKLMLMATPFVHKLFDLREEGYNYRQIIDKYRSVFTKSVPKVLFIYLPLFAFLMWLFHNKKNWWYFDHGVFTLHYFSFLLLSILIYLIGDHLLEKIHIGFLDTLWSVFSLVYFIYVQAYFFIAHKAVYKNTRNKTLLKGIGLYLINMILIAVAVTALAAWTFLHI